MCNNVSIEEELSKAFPGISEEQLWDRPPLANVIYGQAIKTNEKDEDGNNRYKCNSHGNLDCKTCFNWLDRVLQEFREVATTFGKEVPPGTNREEKLGLLAAMGVKLPPTTLLSEKAIDKKLKGALDAAQNFAKVFGETVTEAIRPGSFPLWAGGFLKMAVYRENVVEASTPRANMFPLYANALVELRASLLSIAEGIDSRGGVHVIMQDKDQGTAICFRVVEVRNVNSVPMIIILYSRVTRNAPIGSIPIWAVEPLRSRKLIQVTATLEEQMLMLSFLHANSKRLAPEYQPARKAEENTFVPSFILPVGSISQMDLGRLSSDSGCVVCGEKGEKKCKGCFSVRYCGADCQKSHWREHKTFCKTLTGGIWQDVTFSVVPEGEQSGTGPLRYLNVQTSYNPLTQNLYDAAVESPAGCPNVHGNAAFLIKIQRHTYRETNPMLIYDRQRSLQVHLNRSEDPQSHAKLTGQMKKKNAFKIYRWARRIGDVQLAVCLDKGPLEDPSW
ncbi:hypothetical protein AAF712_012535 [Marasmius tenuissimus]|uniref:MYND-type domain-containing protein n=1 Tax=Marasmius tenuissimus TaxID=585030 RepID=A0ABR2ZH68_9AGAR